MELEQLIDEFNVQTGIENAGSAQGVWRYSADGHVFGITSDARGDRLYLFGDIQSPSAGREERFRKAALEANYFFRGTAGATLAINPDSGAYALVMSESLANITPEHFFTLIETFVNSLATWSAIADGSRSATSGDDAAAAQTGGDDSATSTSLALDNFSFLQV